MIQHKKANAQIVAAIWGTLVVHDNDKCKTTRLRSLQGGKLTDQAPKMARMFQKAVERCRGVSGTEAFFEVRKDEWEEKWDGLLLNQTLGDTFCTFDPQILRASFWMKNNGQHWHDPLSYTKKLSDRK